MACLKLLQHLQFIGCRDEAAYFVASKEISAKTYPRQILNEKTDISGTNKVIGALEMMVRALDEFQAKKQMRSWKEPSELGSLQVFPLPITHFLPNMFLNPYFFVKGRQIT